MTAIQNKKTFLIYTGIIIVAVILINLVSRNFFFRLDLTDNKMYSLSPSSKSVLKKIDDLLTIKIYFSENLPGEYGNTRRYLQDILEEYEAYADGNLRFEFYQPDDDEELATEAQKYGIQPVQLQVIENDKLEIKRVYMGMVFLYEDQREIIPVIQTTTGLEYDITTKIKKLVDKQRKTIAFATIDDQTASNDNIANLLRETYNVRNIKLSKPIPKNIDLVIFNGVEDSLSSDEYNNLREFVIRGGNLLIAQGRVKSNLRTQRASLIKSNIFDLLDEFGLHVEDNLVLDQICSNVTVSQNRGFFQINTAMSYPFFPLIRNFSDHAMVSGLEQVSLLFTSEITPDSGAAVIPLFKTSDRSGVMRNPFNLSPIDNPALRRLREPGKIVAAYATVQADTAAPTGQIILIGDSEFFTDNGGGRSNENFVFVMNAVDYLIGDSNLVALRSREITTRPLKEIDDSAKARWKWVNILLPALLVIGLGLIQWKREARRTKQLEELYD
ncbi:MAG: GldG family protein [FCB group bacterium]|nr:GldG family protein [FCB group bacterium]